MQMKEKKTSVFEIESIPKAVAVLAIPSVLSMLVTVLYNMVDTVFVGQTHDPYQMNAVSMATPVFMILMAFGTRVESITGESMESNFRLYLPFSGRTGI